MIYFIQAGAREAIKIGFSKNAPRSRLKNLQIGNHLTLSLLGSIDGELEDEGALHRRFYSDHIRGEWFRPSPPLVAFIKVALGVDPFEGWSGSETPVAAPSAEIDVAADAMVDRFRRSASLISESALPELLGDPETMALRMEREMLALAVLAEFMRPGDRSEVRTYHMVGRIREIDAVLS